MAFAACSDDPAAPPPPPTTLVDPDAPGGPVALEVEVVATHPHDTDAFTQGLLVDDRGRLIEGTGLRGASQLRVVDLESGEAELAVDLPEEVFGEGVAQVEDRFIQLTWTEGIAFVRDVDTLEEEDRLTYEGEGWGLCHDGEALVMSNGSSTLTFRDPRTFEPLRTVSVSLAGQPLDQLNELECTEGRVWANVWQTDTLVAIDPASGEVVATVDASGLLSADEREGADVLNGIAAVPGGDTFYITGKLWPRLFEVRFTAPEPAGDPNPTDGTDGP